MTWFCCRAGKARPLRPAGRHWGRRVTSYHELFAQDTFFQVVFRIEKQRHHAIGGLADHHFHHVARLVRVGGGTDRALVRVEHLEADLGVGLEDRTAPATRAERGDRRQRDRVRAQRQDRTVRGKVVGGAAGRGRHHHPVADQLVQPRLAVEVDAHMRGLPRLAQQRDFVVGQRAGAGAGFGLRHHLQRAQLGRLGGGDPPEQVIGVEMVHEETNGAQLHAVDRLAQASVAVERLQHETVAAQRADHIRLLGRVLAVARDHRLQRLLGIGRAAGEEGDAGAGAHHDLRREPAG